jgi:protein-tyrosine phosphatase
MTTTPYPVAWVEASDRLNLGRLGFAMAPGRRDFEAGVQHARDLHADLHALQAHGVDTLVSLLPDAELQLLGIGALEAGCAANGLQLVRLPIEDGGVPNAAQAAPLQALLLQVAQALQAGGTVVYHCRAGQGRSGTLAALTLCQLGMAPQAAIDAIRRANPKAIETDVQAERVRAAAVG